MEAIRRPRLLRRALDGSGRLTEAGRLRPSALAAEMNLTPLSRADMTLEADDLPVAVRDLVEIFGQNGSLGVFRVTSVETVCGGQRQLRLNHALDMFSDVLAPGAAEAETAAQTLNAILAAQTETLNGRPYWALGTVAETAGRGERAAWTNAMECLTALAAREADCRLDCDFSCFPWRISLLPREDAVVSEFRLPRNVESCRVTLDDSALCTRLYLSVETAAADGVSEQVEVYDDLQAQARWGVVSRAAAVSAAQVPDRAAWARRYFARCGQPSARIEIDGAELNRLTGERLDRVRLGGVCRVALPGDRAVFEERVVCLRYPDLLGQPERVRVTLANRAADAGSLLGSLTARAGAAERALRADSRQIVNNRFTLTAHDQHITEQGLILHAAGLELDPHGVWLFASEDGAQTGLGAAFAVQAGQIESIVRDTEGHESRITQNAREIEAKADKVTVSALRTTVSNLITGRETADSLRATTARLGDSHGGTVYIYGQQVRVYSVEDTGGNVRHVFGYA